MCVERKREQGLLKCVKLNNHVWFCDGIFMGGGVFGGLGLNL